MPTDPHSLFEEWLVEARASEPNDPEAMALATADGEGRPSVRMVLLKGHDERGFVFYTNRLSRKGEELAANPTAALLFHWKSLRRQVRVEGTVEAVTDAEADAYFATRARDSQLGAWASDQSQPLDSRSTFEARYQEMKARFEGRQVPRPPHWSGFRVVPGRIEFWNDRAHRLHERRLFTRKSSRLDRRPALPVTSIHHHGHDHHHAHGTLTARAAMASVSIALFLLLLKGFAAFQTGSVAMLGSLADTGLDLVASLVTLYGVRFAAMPADHDHRFGHGKAEALAALFQVALITVSAVGIGWRAADRLVNGETTANAEYGIAVSLIAIGTTFGLLFYQRRVIARTGSVAIEADHVHYQSDLLLNLSVVGALVLDQYLGLTGADPLFGIGIALWLLVGASRASSRAIDQLMDREWPEEKRMHFLELASRHPELRGIHDLRTRTSGSRDFVQFHVWVDPQMTVAEAHRVMDEVEHKLAHEFSGAEILIHLDPEGQVDQPGNMLVETDESKGLAL